MGDSIFGGKFRLQKLQKNKRQRNFVIFYYVFKKNKQTNGLKLCGSGSRPKVTMGRRSTSLLCLLLFQAKWVLPKSTK